MELATVNNVGWAPFLDDQLYVKFGILDRDTDQPKVYFINSNTYTIHASFWNGIGASVNGDDASGEIVFNPNTILPQVLLAHTHLIFIWRCLYLGGHTKNLRIISCNMFSKVI